ncbi:MAG: hypothetical protein ACI861_001307 [Paracoccaceae bacterium]|jgi:hypothetical protein
MLKKILLSNALNFRGDYQRASDIDDFMSHSNGIEIEDEGGVRSRLMDSGFLYWSPFAASDGMTGPMRAKLWSDIGLNGFPFDD